VKIPHNAGWAPGSRPSAAAQSKTGIDIPRATEMSNQSGSSRNAETRILTGTQITSLGDRTMVKMPTA
jgi:hypothetical protein